MHVKIIFILEVIIFYITYGNFQEFSGYYLEIFIKAIDDSEAHMLWKYNIIMVLFERTYVLTQIKIMDGL